MIARIAGIGKGERQEDSEKGRWKPHNDCLKGARMQTRGGGGGIRDLTQGRMWKGEETRTKTNHKIAKENVNGRRAKYPIQVRALSMCLGQSTPTPRIIFFVAQVHMASRFQHSMLTIDA